MDLASYFKNFGIAITGGVATGKSFVAQLLRERGRVVFDADSLSREVMQPGTRAFEAIVGTFGREILDPGGKIDRRHLGRVVFGDKARRQDLEQIVHPAIRLLLESKVAALQAKNPKKHWFYEAALVFETRQSHRFAQIWVTWCPESVQLERIIQRDSKNRSAAMQIVGAQAPAEEKRRLADVVVDTSGTKSSVSLFVDQLLRDLGDKE